MEGLAKALKVALAERPRSSWESNPPTLSQVIALFMTVWPE
jgi:hypothetical protein